MTKSELIQLLHNGTGDPVVQIEAQATRYPIVSVMQFTRLGPMIIYSTNIPPASPKDDVHKLLHKLWGKAIGTSDYNKDEWMAFQRLLE